MSTGLLPAGPGPGLTVRRVRARSRPAGRARVLDALDRLDPDTGLPRPAILLVRSLTGAVAGDPSRVEGIDLRAAAGRAHRASTGPVPFDCGAVVFADEAELLACLAADVAAGRPLGWWWSTLLGEPTRPEPPLPAFVAVTKAFTVYARALPAAVAEAAQPVSSALAVLPPAEGLRILGLVTEAHALPALAAVVHRAWQSAGAAAARPAPIGRRSAVDGGRSVAPPPARSTPPAGAVTAVLVDTLVRVRRDPVGLRTTAAAEAVGHSIAVAMGWADAAPPPPPGPDDRPGPATDPRPPAPVAVVPPAPGSPSPVPDPGPSVLSLPAPAPGLAPLPDPGPGPRLVPTALGGAFYLLHILDRLDLPASADGPGEPGALLDRWGVLALVLTAWGADPEDPLLALLDELRRPVPDDDACPWTYRDPPEARLGGELCRVSHVPRGSLDKVRSGTPSARWGVRVADLLLALLGRVGLDEGMIRVPATVEVSDLAVQVRLRLDDVDLRVRRAGLDRDPGWVPALGRTVELVFG